MFCEFLNNLFYLVLFGPILNATNTQNFFGNNGLSNLNRFLSQGKNSLNESIVILLKFVVLYANPKLKNHFRIEKLTCLLSRTLIFMGKLRISFLRSSILLWSDGTLSISILNKIDCILNFYEF